MKNQIFSSIKTIALLLVLAMGTGCQAQTEKATFTESQLSIKPEAVQVVTPAEAQKLIATNASLQVLDVRTPEEVAQGIVQGAKIINWFDANFMEVAQQSLDKHRAVLVYCKAGSRSAQAAEKLHSNGFGEVYNLAGGILQWQSDGFPVQK